MDCCIAGGLQDGLLHPNRVNYSIHVTTYRTVSATAAKTSRQGPQPHIGYCSCIVITNVVCHICMVNTV